MKSLPKYVLVFFAIWIVQASPAIASEWEKVGGDALKAAVNNTQWQAINFAFYWREDGKMLHVVKRGGKSVEKWWIEEDGTTICYTHLEQETRCLNLQKQGSEYRMEVTKADKNEGRIWNILIKDEMIDF